MARPAKDWRPEIAQAALAAFSAGGYRLTQVADVARRMNIAVGTIYTQVSGKAALFDLAVRRALDLPLDRVNSEGTTALIKREVARRARWPRLDAAQKARRPRDPAVEVTGILEELFDLCAEGRRLIDLLDACAFELPALAALQAKRLKGGYIADFAAYVARRERDGSFRPTPDTAATARAAMEAVVWMAAHRHNDTMPPAVDETTARRTVVELVARGLLA